MKTYKAPKAILVDLEQEAILAGSDPMKQVNRDYTNTDVTYSKGINGLIIDDDEEE